MKTKKWWQLRMLYLVAVLLFVATFALKTYAPNAAAKKAAVGTLVKADARGTPVSIPYHDRAHSPTLSNTSQESQKRLVKNYGKLPLSFEANRGQTDPQVKFLSRGPGYTVFLTSTEAVLALHGSEGRPTHASPRPRILEKFQAHRSHSSAAALTLGISPLKDSPALLSYRGSRNLAQSELPSSPEPKASAVLRMKLVGANPSPRVAGLNQLPGKSNYFLGKDRNKWRTNVPIYAKVKYESVYPGVDLVYYGNQGQLEYDFVVGPSANPRDIALNIQGANRLNVDGQGDLLVNMSGEVVRFHKPSVYQPEDSSSEIQNRKLKIDGRYVLQGESQVGFQVAAYDASKPLVIDPVLSYSTFLGGSGDDFASFLDGVAVDPRGNAYIIGITTSTDFPTTAGAFQTTFGGIGDGFFTGDAFVAKLNAAGNALVYSTYLGGTADDMGESIAVDAAGHAYLSGQTFSTDFPTMNPIQAANAGGLDAFVAKLNRAGDALVYSTYLGGSDWDFDPMIEIDPRGNAYLEGWTVSTDFPTTAGAFQTTFGGAADAWAAKVNPAGDALVYSTYLGGTGEDICGAQIAIDRPGNVYVNGFTNSTDFPTTPGTLQTTLVPGTCVDDNGNTFPCHDSFLTKLNRDGTGLVYSTYLGGSAFEFILGTAVDSVGNAYVNGLTFSNDFPTLNPYQAAYAGGGDAFMAKLNRHGTRLVYSTYLGGSGDDEGGAIVLDSRGNVYVEGVTTSTNFPTTLNAFQPAFGGGFSDAFVAKISRSHDNNPDDGDEDD